MGAHIDVASKVSGPFRLRSHDIILVVEDSVASLKIDHLFSVTINSLHVLTAQVVLLMGGNGSRFQPLSTHLPQHLFPD